jgi:hypothetical protein
VARIRLLLVCFLLAIGVVTTARADTTVTYMGNPFNVSVSESSSLLLLGTGLLGLLGAWRRKRLFHRSDVRRLFIFVRRRLRIL